MTMFLSCKQQETVRKREKRALIQGLELKLELSVIVRYYY